ncbi:DeoR/GlpR family DNA-binding transcription regulator [Entomohabitans teleogrylli]|uniref:DeoR/GlpR family DNA-binding transcription regulator n=1 Tax=Entomohabitans teleogrylli TaxID=1384589 RepID=UPI00073D67ED|nr:DeoR/GlpR family DNA-binding transcription regulator [Entomohabitans teleogrylli]
MLPLERHRLILQLLGQSGVMRVNDIAAATGVSRETIRRDLSDLQRKGALSRSHGGALLAANALPVTALPPPAMPAADARGSFRQRTQLNCEAKARIARRALRLLQPGDSILLDGSTTSWFVARQLPEMELTVITPSVSILQTLISRRSLRLVGLGGEFSAAEESFFGEATARMLQAYQVDRLFFSCQGLERDSGLYAGSEAHASLLREMMIAARQVVALLDASKFGHPGVARISGLGELDILIAEPFNDPLLEKEMTWHNVEVFNA